MNGVIKKKVEGKNFGFITYTTPEGQEKDVFFHNSGLVDVTFDELQMGDKVSFDTAETEKGTNAVNVKRA